MINALDTKLKYARYFTWGSYTLFVISRFVVGRLETPPAPTSLLLITTLPLILLLPGMARENYKSLAMLSFLTLLYFIPLVVDVMAPDANKLDYIPLTMICILFVASMMFSRWAQYYQAGLGK